MNRSVIPALSRKERAPNLGHTAFLRLEEHAVAVAEEAVLLADGVFVGL